MHAWVKKGVLLYSFRFQVTSIVQYFCVKLAQVNDPQLSFTMLYRTYNGRAIIRAANARTLPQDTSHGGQLTPTQPGTRRTPNSANRRGHDPFRTGSSEQCICGRWGHSVKDCRMVGMVYHINKWIREHKDDAKIIASSWTNQQSAVRQSGRAAVRALRKLIPDGATFDDDDLLERMADADLLDFQ